MHRMKWWIAGLGVLVANPCIVPAAGDSVVSDNPATMRLLTTVRVAMEQWREARASLFDADIREASARAEGAAGSPFAVWYTEGIGSSFSRTVSSQNTLQVGTPFNFPGQHSAARSYVKAAVEGAAVDREMLVVHVARRAGELWVKSAAMVERIEVRRDRLDRLDEALALQEARFQLGEVAGTEVMQLDLEHVRETSMLAALMAESEGVAAQLRELCGSGCELPLLGDLEALADTTSTPEDEQLTVQRVEAGGLLRQARAHAAEQQARSRLVGKTAFGRPVIALDWENFPSYEGIDSWNAWGVMLTVPLPVGKAGRQQRVAARAEADASLERIEGTRNELLRRAESARNDAQAAVRRLATLDTVLADLAEIENSLEQQFRLGAVAYLAYIDGVARLDEIRIESVLAREQLLLARIELGTILADSAVFPLPEQVQEAMQ